MTTTIDLIRNVMTDKTEDAKAQLKELLNTAKEKVTEKIITKHVNENKTK